MGLYVATFEVTMVVAGESAEAAEGNAQDYLGEAASDMLFPGAASCRPARVERDIPTGWLDSIPYASEDDRTVRQILAEPPRPDAAQTGANPPTAPEPPVPSLLKEGDP